MNATIKDRVDREQDAEARVGERHFGHRRWPDWRPGFLPFQFQIPLGGGAPGLAIPLGGYGAPFAFTLPLGGYPPAPQPPAAVAVPVPVPTFMPSPAEAPVTVAAADLPLYLPPTQADGEAVDGRDQAERLGERLLFAAEAAGADSAAFLESLAGEELGAAHAGLFEPPGAGGRAPSATELFNLLLQPQHWPRRQALQRHYLDRFEILARPGERLARVVPRPGDLLLRVAVGEGWGSVAVVGSRGLHPHIRLAAQGLRGEGYPRLEPGSYVHVVEPGPRFRNLAARFARRVGTAGNVLSDTLLLRLRPVLAPVVVSEADPGSDGRSASRVAAAVLRPGDGGEPVRQAQAKLNRIHADLTALGLPGLTGCPLPEDGRFAQRMAHAVLDFQQQVFGDPAQWVGVIGPATRSQLDLLAGRGAPRPALPVEAVSGDPQFIRWVQTALNELIGAGLTVDGQPGPRTRAAVRAFQSSHGLTPDGVVGPRTEAALRGGGGRPLTLPTRCTGVPERQTLDHFEFGKADVLPRHQPQIVNLAFCILASQRSATPIATLTVIGHTDPVGSDEENLALGRRRAEAVRDQITEAIRRISGASPRLTVTVETRGEREPVPGDPALSRRVDVVLPFAFPRHVPPPPPPPPVAPDAALRALLTASMLLAGKPTAPFKPGALPVGRQAGRLWGFDMALGGGAMTATNITCIIPHPGGHSHAMTVLEEAVWERVELALSAGGRATLPFDPRFLIGSFSATSGSIAARSHRIWRLASDIDAGTAAIFAYDISDPANPQPVADIATLRPSRPGQSSGRLWALVCCELVLCRTRNDFEPAGVLDAARLYPLIEVLTNADTATIRGVVRIRRPGRSSMDHGWANGGRHLVGLFADRNNNMGLLEAMLSLVGSSGAAIPTWEDVFDYFEKDGAATARRLVMVDRLLLSSRSDSTRRQALDRRAESNVPTAVLKMPRQGAFDNAHIAPPMEVNLSIPLLGGIPSTAVSMAPVCAHDCFHMHWRWSQHYTAEQNLGWGPAGPYTLAGAPMVHPNQTVAVGLTAGVPGLRYEAEAAAHPANDWMVVMPHGAAYAVEVRISAASLLDRVLAHTGLPGPARSAITRAVAGAEDRAFAWFYFFLQFWPALQSSPRLRPLDVLTADVPFLSRL